MAAPPKTRAGEQEARRAPGDAAASSRPRAPVRAWRQARAGHLGLALMELGFHRSRLERLKRVAGHEGGNAKRAARVAFYGLTRTAARAPGAATVAGLLERTAPGAWGWLKRRSDAYAAAARGAIAPREVARRDAARSARGDAAPGPLRPTRIVHQFHSGSAVGDAVTNGMVLIQRWLRTQGYEGEIFVQHRDKALAGRMLEMDDLPQRGDQMLIVHHSMGYDGADRILRVPAGKVLVYHSITPKEFLRDAPWYLPYEALGRELLDTMRPHMSAALAPSHYNAIELRARGYASPQTCVFLFDVDALLARSRTAAQAAPQRAADAPFTLLFVGRVVPSKSQAELVDAFAAFRAGFGKPCRLVLVGRSDGPAAVYPAEIQRRIAQHGLQDSVILTGGVSDEALHGWYRAADLYVSLSQHEGFGVPLVEAMAHGVPIAAWPAGAVPYTLGGAGVLLRDRAPEAVARVLLNLAADPGRRAAIVARQRTVLEGFRIENQAPAMLAALAAAGAVPPPPPGAHAALVAQMHIAVAGHVKGTYSLAAINRTLAAVLDAGQPGTVRLLPWENGPLRDIDDVPAGERDAVIALSQRPAPVTSPSVVISQHYPLHLPTEPADATFALLAWEESLLPAEMVGSLNGAFTGVLAPSGFVAKSLLDSGTAIPVLNVGQAPSLVAFHALGAERAGRQRAAGAPVIFLHVSSCFPRKGVDVLIASFARSFRATDPVRLVIKGFPNPHNEVEEQLAALNAADPDAPRIDFINRDMEEEELLGLYREADCMVLPARGEGFNMPAAEAMAAGIPLIVTGFGGHLDFCTAEDARFVDYAFAQSRSHVASTGSLWVEPDADDLCRALREAFEDIAGGTGRFAARAATAQEAVQLRLAQPAWGERIRAGIADVLLAPPAAAPRLVWVSSWDIACGVAEYSRFILDRIIATKPPDALTILCDARTALPETARTYAVQIAWGLGDDTAAGNIARAISQDAAEAVVIQHQPGLLDWPELARLLRDRRLAGRVVVVTLHAVRPLLDLDAAARAGVVEALGRAARVLVHRVEDVNILKEAGLVANVALFPHGAPPRHPTPPARALTAQDAPVIGCFGFFVPGKGLPRLIEAFARLRTRWPRARLRLLNALHPFDNGRELAQCRKLAEKLGVAAMVEWDTAFHPKQQVIARLAECDLIVLPYDESKESSSGAIRVALASGAPVAVTPVTIFDEASAAVHRFDSLEVEEVVRGMDALLADREARQRCQDAAAAWLADLAWEGLAQRLQGMLQGLHVNRRPSPLD